MPNTIYAGGVSSYILRVKTARGSRIIEVKNDHGLQNLIKWKKILTKMYWYADNWVCSYDDHESLNKYFDLCVWELGWVQDPMSFYERYNGRPHSKWLIK